MSRLDPRAYATLALIALAGIASVDAAGVNSCESHERRPPEKHRQVARRKPERRHGLPAHPVHAEAAHGTPAHQPAFNAPQHPVINHLVHEPHPASVGGGHAVAGSPAAGQVRVVRFGNTVSGTVERTIRPGLISRTFVGGGHVLYTHVYQSHVWHQFGRAIPYETFVPAVRYPAAYYGWALAAWPHPVTYTWGWQVQPWYPRYGVLFTPYPVYTSPDLWMTDYIIAQSMQTAYQAQPTAPALEPSPAGVPAAPAMEPSPLGVPVAPAPDSSVVAPVAQPDDALPIQQSSGTPSVAAAKPPAITPQIKAQLNTQIKVRLQEQQAAVATPATLTTQSTPPALRPNHVFFQVVQSLQVPSGTANRYCSLSTDDYIKRTGGMSQDDWMIPVVVELSGPSDCPAGLQTRIALNDLNAMENEQEAQVMEAMQAASKSMGPNGPPSGPGAQPSLIADGNAAAYPSALDAIRQAR